MPNARKFTTLLAAAALCVPVAACGESDLDKAREDVQNKASELQGDIDGLSRQDLEAALADVEDAAKNGSAETKQKARELERKIERELNERK
jgi:hypothetical protein